MIRKPASMMLLSLLVMGMLALTFRVQPVGASGAIYIRADGSIDPPTAPIYAADNITYILAGGITSGADGIIVERDNIILNGAGYTVQGTGSGTGITLSGRTNVTMQNTTIKAFNNGIVLYYSASNSIAGNTIAANSYDGIVLDYSSNDSIAGNTIAANSHDGIVLDYSSNDSIARNSIMANSFHGILLDFSSNISIAGNNITNNDYGIYLYSSSNINITGNNITNNDYGIYLGSSSNYNSMAENNITANNFDGLHLVSSSNNSIAENNITANNFDGIYLYSSSNNSIAENNITANNWYGIDLDYSSNNNVAGNNITANNHYGVYLYYSSNTNIVRDNITNNGYGVYLYSSSNTNIVRDNIANNGYGILLESSFSNSIYHNNFVNNTVQAIIPMTASNAWDNGYPSGGNYWSGYTGTDVKKGPNQDEPGSDNLGDVPYVLDENNRDNYPLIYAYGVLPPATYALTIATTAYGTTNPPPGTYTYSQGQTVPVQAIPDSACVLDHWELDKNFGGTNNSTSVVMDTNHTLLAVFKTLLIHDIAIINLTLSKTVVFQGYNCSDINVTVANHGNYTETFKLAAYANDTTTGNTTCIVTFTNVTLASGTSKNLTFDWNTTGFAKGNYTISAYAEPVQGELNTANNNFTGGWVVVSMVGDLTGGSANPWNFVPDGKVDGKDIATVALCYGSAPGCPPPYIWNANCDVNGDGKVDGKDIAIVAIHYGQAGP